MIKNAPGFYRKEAYEEPLFHLAGSSITTSTCDGAVLESSPARKCASDPVHQPSFRNHDGLTIHFAAKSALAKAVL